MIYELVIGSERYVEEKKKMKKECRNYLDHQKQVLKLMMCCKRSSDFCYHDIINQQLGMTQRLCGAVVESLQMEIFQIAWRYPSEQCSHMWNGTCHVQLNSISKFAKLRKLHLKGDWDIQSGL